MIQIPFLLDVDSYKLTHSEMYPQAQKMTAYYTHRGPLLVDDRRIVFFGMRYQYETILNRQITMEDIEVADEYLTAHGVAKSQFPYPRDLFLKVVEENNGYWPVTIRALRDGTVVHPGVPCFTISAEAPYERLVTWLETRLMRIWSPSVTATKSAMVRTHLQHLFNRTVDEESMFLLDSRFHDFGSRGVSSQETAMTAGVAHLLSFEGTDTIIAGWLATEWNNGIHVGESVYASEHSVMTAWASEEEALANLIEITPRGSILSCVADSYNYSKFLTNIVPKFVEAIREKELFFVVRPDSGDPVECVIEGLKALEKAFGATTNSKGYKVINGAGVIQGDGIDIHKLFKISNKVERHGYSAQCVAYGMGGGLLQKQNRDTLKVAIKLCEVTDLDGTVRPIMKRPTGDVSKISLPGDFKVLTREGIPTVYPREAPVGWEDTLIETDLLETIWDNGPTGYVFETFQEMRERLDWKWNSLPNNADPISQPMAEKIQHTMNLLAG